MLREPHRRAGVAYATLGLCVLLLTFLFDLVPPEREGVELQLLVGGVFIAIFAVLIYRGWWILSLLLVFTNLWRAFQFLNQGLGPTGGPAGDSSRTAEPLALINALLLLVVVAFLVHSAWTGWRRHRESR
ncbi:MAG: hypothetical protein R3234_00295 [Thermoanaerobaculia bacterium]|nr:hypothetical protein [Thermoanaerobaculia bacterium]